MAQRALIGRYADFWLLGGASVALWLAVVLLAPLRYESWAVKHHFDNLAALSASLSLLVNYPHFMASYRLAYSRGFAFCRRYALQLVIVPLALLGALAYAYLHFDKNGALGQQVGAVLHAFDLFSGGLGSRNQGEVVMGLLINLMYLTVGWHYSKQTYGCMMVYARFDGYSLTEAMRRLLRYTSFSVWIVNYCYLNATAFEQEYYGISYLGWGLAEGAYLCSQALFLSLLALTLYKVFWANYRDHGRWPSAPFIIPFLAFVVWWVPPFMNQDFLVFAAPFFHSLQYLAFVYKVEKNLLQKPEKQRFGLWAKVLPLVLVGSGFLFFEQIPNLLDLRFGFGSAEGPSVWFFFCSFHIFINIHHYFLDNALWRLQDARLRDLMGL